MKKLGIIPLLSLLLAAAGCSCPVTLRLTGEVINPYYMGNGVEWDPYDEALSWGGEVSEADWNTLFWRLDFMRPQYVRCMINSPFTYFDGTGFDDERNAAYIRKLLEYCQSRGVMVVYGEYNPPTWDMKGSAEWVEASVRHLNWLVSKNGFTCIRHFVIFNEPDGDWASTNGDFAFWKQMVHLFRAEMDKYPALSNISIAGPDAVIDYSNRASAYDALGWLNATVREVPEIGIYDMHAYPGQRYVRSGEFFKTLRTYKEAVGDMPIILGEVGFKYFADEADAALAQVYWERVKGHPYTKGSDCNMLVYDYFYALDVTKLLMDVMNSGFSGAAAWMLDDAMHSNGDSGKPEDLKIWGMWNILGNEVFGNDREEEIRSWYYTWSLMCRHFPAGSKIMRLEGELPENVDAVAAILPDGSYSIAAVNYSDKDQIIRLELPTGTSGYMLSCYDAGGFRSHKIIGTTYELSAQSFAIFAKE